MSEERNETIPLNRPQDKNEWRQLEEAWNSSPAFKRLGVTVDLSDSEQMILSLSSLSSLHTGDFGNLGMTTGIMGWLCDFAIGLFSSLHLPDGYKGTADLHVEVCQPMTTETCRVISRIERCSSSLCRASAVILDQHDRLCVKSWGRVMYIQN